MASDLGSVWGVLYRPTEDGKWQAWGDVAFSRTDADYLLNVTIPHHFNDGLMERRVIEVQFTLEEPNAGCCYRS